MPSLMVILITLIACGFAASFLAQWLQQGKLDFTRTKTCVLLIVALAVVCYVNSFGNGFVWDDSTLIVENPAIRNWRHWTHDFVSDLYNNPVTQTFYYRPLQSLSYRLDYSLWGLHPDGYHVLNIAFHVGNSILVFLLIRRFSQSNALGLACGALFAVHPIHTQAITYISGRADPMCTFFLLLTLWFYDKARTKGGAGLPLAAVGIEHDRKRDACATVHALLPGYWLALLSYAGALGSKEFAVFFPMLLMAYETCVASPKEKKPWVGATLRLLPFVLLIVGWILVRISIFGCFAPPSSTQKPEIAPVILSLRALAAYFSLLLAPLNLHMEQTVAFGGWKGTQLTLTGTVAWIALAGLIVIYWRRSRTIVFALLWFLIFFLPVSNLWKLNATLAEHWMYFPSIGFIWAGAIIVGDLLGRWPRTAGRSAEIGATVVLFFVLLFAGRTILRNFDWRDPITFYSRTIAAGGGTARVHNNHGMALLSEKQDTEGAERAYRAALKIDPEYDIALNNLGLIYLQKREFDKAIPLFQEVIREHPSRVEAYLNLATTHWELGRTNATWQTFEDALVRFPQSTTVAIRYGIFALHHDDLARAERVLKHGQQIAPDSADFANALGGLAIQVGKYDDAIALLNHVKQLDKFTTNPYVNLAYLYQKEGKYADAERELFGARKLEPFNVEYKYRLGVLYWRAGQTNDAKRELNEALQMVPEFAAAKETLQKWEAGIPYDSGAAGTLIDLRLQQPGR